MLKIVKMICVAKIESYMKSHYIMDKGGEGME